MCTLIDSDLLIDPKTIAEIYPACDLDSPAVQRLQETEPFEYVPDGDEEEEVRIFFLSSSLDVLLTIAVVLCQQSAHEHH